jgi:hypothetical protein
MPAPAGGDVVRIGGAETDLGDPRGGTIEN